MQQTYLAFGLHSACAACSIAFHPGCCMRRASAISRSGTCAFRWQLKAGNTLLAVLPAPLSWVKHVSPVTAKKLLTGLASCADGVQILRPQRRSCKVRSTVNRLGGEEITLLKIVAEPRMLHAGDLLSTWGCTRIK